MTAYGRTVVTTSMGRVSVEIQSVNRKGLDISVHLPKEWLFLEMPLRQRVAEHVSRGYVGVRIAIETGPSQKKSFPAASLLRDMQRSLEALAVSLHYDPKKAISFEWLVKEASIISKDLDTSAEEVFTKEILAGTDTALQAWKQMKETEGNHLITELRSSLSKIQDTVETLAKIASHHPTQYRKKLQERLQKLDETVHFDEERLMREVILFVDKVDVSEELCRLRSHCAQFHSQMESTHPCIGTDLGFLTQEMLREANTCGAKLLNLEAIQAVLTIKSELEKIREQVRNLE